MRRGGRTSHMSTTVGTGTRGPRPGIRAPRRQAPPRDDPRRQGPPRDDPRRQGPPRDDPRRQDPRRQDPRRQDPRRADPDADPRGPDPAQAAQRVQELQQQVSTDESANSILQRALRLGMRAQPTLNFVDPQTGRRYATPAHVTGAYAVPGYTP